MAAQSSSLPPQGDPSIVEMMAILMMLDHNDVGEVCRPAKDHVMTKPAPEETSDNSSSQSVC